MTLEEVVEEYASAFGDGAPYIRAYIDYWAQFATRMALPYGRAGQFPDGLGGGLFEQAVIEHDLSRQRPRFWDVMPYLYTDERMDQAFVLLAKAEEAAGADEQAAARVRFLYNGLKQFQLLRQTLEAKEHAAGGNASEVRRYHQLFDELAALRREITPSHAVWGGLQFRREPGTAPAESRRGPETLADEE